jgi:hypothetical protein
MDLLLHPGPCDCSSTPLTSCSPADTVHLPIPPDTRDLARRCRGSADHLLTPWPLRLLADAADLLLAEPAYCFAVTLCVPSDCLLTLRSLRLLTDAADLLLGR